MTSLTNNLPIYLLTRPYYARRHTTRTSFFHCSLSLSPPLSLSLSLSFNLHIDTIQLKHLLNINQSEPRSLDYDKTQIYFKNCKFYLITLLTIFLSQVCTYKSVLVDSPSPL